MPAASSARRVCDALLARGDEVVGLTRDPRRARQTNPTRRLARLGADPGAPAGRGLRGRRRRRQPDRRADQPALDRRGEAADPREPRAGTKNLVDGDRCASSATPRVLVSQSAVGYYGDRGDAIVDESTPAWRGLRRRGLRRLGGGRARPRDRRAPRDRPHRPRARPGRRPARSSCCCPSSSASAARSPAAPSTCPGSTSTTRSALLLWALDNEKVSGAINATAPNPVTNQRVLEGARARCCGRPAVMPVPGITLDLMYGREFGAVLRGGQRVLPRRALDLGYEFKHPELDEALEDLL